MDWEGDFGPYSAISIVNPVWIDLVMAETGPGALTQAYSPATAHMLERELGSQIDVLLMGTATSGTDTRLPCHDPSDHVPGFNGLEYRHLRFASRTPRLSLEVKWGILGTNRAQTCPTGARDRGPTCSPREHISVR